MRHIYFTGFSLLLIALYFKTLKDLVGLATLGIENQLYSHFLLIPFVSFYLLYKKRRAVFSEVSNAVEIGIPIAIIGILFYWLGDSRVSQLNQNNWLSLMMFSFVACFIGGFIAFYGPRAFREGMFPLLFLIFFVPFPTVIIEPLIKVLQFGSAETSYMVFNIIGVPVFRQGFVFELSGITIEVAEQCSGINSTMALLITGVLAGYLFLQTGWRRVVLVLSIFPIAIFKNSLRIVTISLLANYVDPIFLTNHWIHSAGGKPFFILALLVMLPVLWLLRRSEKKKQDITNALLETQNG